MFIPTYVRCLARPQNTLLIARNWHLSKKQKLVIRKFLLDLCSMCVNFHLIDVNEFSLRSRPLLSLALNLIIFNILNYILWDNDLARKIDKQNICMYVYFSVAFELIYKIWNEMWREGSCNWCNQLTNAKSKEQIKENRTKNYENKDVRKRNIRKFKEKLMKTISISPKWRC